MKSLQLKVLSVVASALAVVGVAVAPQATAAERNLVAFGDSVLADPDAGSYFAHRFDPSKGVGVDCPNSNNYAKRAGAKLRLPVRDFSCSGAVSMSRGPQVSQQVDAAIRSGALTPATNRVVITTGFNDTYNHRELNLPQIRKQFADRTAPQIERIKRAAPNARVQIVGYPTIGSGPYYCLFHFGPRPADSTFLLPIQDFENKAQWMQVDLAARTGVQFLDMKPSTRNNGMCADANQRMWAGLVDFTGGDGNLPIHMNQRGHEHAANVIARS
ncbi:GDSL-type esterase/lipase family protein [Corynebacterium marquesiae]